MIAPVSGPIAAAIVLEMRAVGRADLDQAAARARHDVGNAEGAADLDQLAARDDRLPCPPRGRASASSTAPALLLTAVAASAPVSAAEPGRDMVVALAAAAPISGRIPARRDRMAATAASIASSASRARPRLVCSTVPVRLKTVRSVDADSASSLSPLRRRIFSIVGAEPPWPCSEARVSCNVERMAAMQAARPNRFTRSAERGARKTASTEGRSRNLAIPSEPALTELKPSTFTSLGTGLLRRNLLSRFPMGSATGAFRTALFVRGCVELMIGGFVAPVIRKMTCRRRYLGVILITAIPFGLAQNAPPLCRLARGMKSPPWTRFAK